MLMLFKMKGLCNFIVKRVNVIVPKWRIFQFLGGILIVECKLKFVIVDLETLSAGTMLTNPALRVDQTIMLLFVHQTKATTTTYTMDWSWLRVLRVCILGAFLMAFY